MRVRAVVASFAVVLITACAPKAVTTGSAADEAAIKATNATYADDWNKGDAKALAALLSEDAHTIEITGDHITGRAAWEAATAANFAVRPAGQTLSISTAFIRWLDGNTASTGGSWSVAGAPMGAPTKGAWSTVTRRTATGWEILTSQVSTDFVPPSPMASDTSKVGR